VGEPLFLIECYASSATAEVAAEMLAQLRSGANGGSGASPVTPMSCIAVPSDEIIYCLVASDSADSVHEALTNMSIGHDRIVGAVEVKPVRGVGP